MKFKSAMNRCNYENGILLFGDLDADMFWRIVFVSAHSVEQYGGVCFQ
jgi:hypothetical protein